jgi:hypothetical protein
MKKGIASQLTINLGGSNRVPISSGDSLRSHVREMNLIRENEENPREYFAVEEVHISLFPMTKQFFLKDDILSTP